MLKTHAVGIDLGTTYSCISYLNEHGEPVTLANQEGELSTPSVVLFDESGEIVVGTEALRHAVVKPNRVIQNAKRFMGDPGKRWEMDGKAVTPLDTSKLILQKLLAAAQQQIGKVDQAVITVPAQFSDVQRQWVIEAGQRAGLQRVDIINEPVAAALCYVLGSEGLWFTELADEQRILVYDLGGGTFDLSLVSYQKNEVNVIASSGDLNLGGIDWNRTLLDAIAKQFTREFNVDPRTDPKSLQFMAIEVENAKRSLTVRQRSALTVQHAGSRKSYQVEQGQFEKLTGKLVDRTCALTQAMLKDNKMGWAHVDVILTVGGASRMPMIRNALKRLGGRTLNTSLSPDQSIAHGATYYAGMLLTNNEFARSILSAEVTQRLATIKQQSVTARGLGILVRDERNDLVPHYLIKPNSPLPASVSKSFGTVVPNQTRVHLRVVESGTSTEQKYVELGTCVIENLPEKLPENSQIEVTIRYDEQARVHVSAKDVTSGREASTEIVREENLVVKEKPASGATDFQSAELKKPEKKQPAALRASESAVPQSQITAEVELLEVLPDLPEAKDEGLAGASAPVPLCNDCGEPLDHLGRCTACGEKTAKKPRQAPRPVAGKKTQSSKVKVRPVRDNGGQARTPRKADSQTGGTQPRRESASSATVVGPKRKRPAKPKPSKPKPSKGKPQDLDPFEEGEEDFWELTE
ncbi:MAG: Hsp70 family protein [Planctomycetota bacterium]|jgi:molecular chaperone DnaK